jgi:hypothetical protein
MKKITLKVLAEGGNQGEIALEDNQKVVGFSSSFWSTEAMVIASVLIEQPLHHSEINTTGKKQHACQLAQEYGALYFYSELFKGWTEKYVGTTSAGAMGVMLTAFFCKYCGGNLRDVSE